MISEELNVEVNKFGELVDKICKEVNASGQKNVCGNQILFARNPETNSANVLGVCFMIPHEVRNMVYYRVLIDGQVFVMTHDTPENIVNVAEADIPTTLGQDYMDVYTSLKKIGSNLMLSAFASFIIEKQDIVLAVQRAATALNNKLNEEKAAKISEGDDEGDHPEPPKKKRGGRKSKKTIVISDNENKETENK